MRVIAEIPHPQIKISIFSWNAKYMVKLEAGNFEQIYKINESDVNGLDQVKEMIDDAFIQTCIQRFLTMRSDFTESFKKVTL